MYFGFLIILQKAKNNADEPYTQMCLICRCAFYLQMCLIFADVPYMQMCFICADVPYMRRCSLYADVPYMCRCALFADVLYMQTFLICADVPYMRRCALNIVGNVCHHGLRVISSEPPIHYHTLSSFVWFWEQIIFNCNFL